MRGPDAASLVRAVESAGLPATATGDGALIVQGDLEQVAGAAAAAGVPLTELRAADGSGLEALFLSLTSDTSRERVDA